VLLAVADCLNSPPQGRRSKFCLCHRFAGF
jgi:hypothetical protein